jgi:hypothetical protein
VAELKKALPKCKIEWTTYKYDDKGNLKAD